MSNAQLPTGAEATTCPEAVQEKTYPVMGLLLIVLSAVSTYGGLYLLLH